MSLQKVLVAEDEFIVAHDLCNTVREAGFAVEGPHPDVSSAMLALQKSKPDLAILDIGLEGGEVHPLAQMLMAEEIPVVFHSGQIEPDQLNEMYPQAYACAKPCPPSQIIETMNQALSTH